MRELIEIAGKSRLSMPEMLEAQRLLAAVPLDAVIPLLERLRSLTELRLKDPNPYNIDEMAIARVWLVSRWADLDAPKALDWVLAHPPPDAESGNSELLGIFATFASKDPAAAGKALDRITEEDVRGEVMVTAATAIGRKDPLAALKWLAAHGDEGSAAETFLQELAEADPASAGALLTKGEPDPGLVKSVTSTWMEKDEAAAQKWAAALPEPLSQVARLEIWRHQLHEKPDDVGREILKLAKSKEDWANDDPLAGLAASLSEVWWGMAQGEKSIQLLAALPKGHVRNEMFQRCMSQNLEVDAPSARKRIDALPPGEERDKALDLLCDHLTTSSAAEAFTAARQIRDESLRQSALVMLFRHWLLQAPHAAVKALDGLPEEERKAIEADLPE